MPCTYRMMENGRTRTPLSFPGLGARAPILGMLDPLPHLPQRSRMLSTPSMTRRLGVPTRVIISLHLGQNPKLGGRYTDVHPSTYHILSVLCISMFRLLSFFLFRFCSCFAVFAFQNIKKTKNIFVVSLHLFP